MPDDQRTQPAPGDAHPLHDEPGKPARDTAEDRDQPRGVGKPGQANDFGRI